MGFKKGREKTGGKQKGTVNHKTREARELMERLNFNPLEFLFHTAMNNWKELGYEKRTETKVLKDGGTIEVDVIQFDSRLTAAKEAAKYTHSQLKAVELSNPQGEGEGFKIIVQEFVAKKE